MGDDSILSAIIILFLLLAAGYFAVCETAFASVSRPRLRAAMDRGDRRARSAVWVTEHFDKAITTILIGTNIVHLTAAAYVTVLVTRRWGLGAVTLSTLLTTVAVFLLGEMLPKSIAKKYSERFSLGTAASLRFFMRIFTPLSALLTAIGKAAAKLTRGEGAVTVTEDELYDIIETMTDEGELDSDQGELVMGALSFGDVTVESILTARVDLDALPVDAPPERVLRLIKSARHSRIPVYEDTVDNIIGVLQIRKYIKAWLQQGEKADLRSLLDQTYFIHQSAKIDELLPVMSSKKLNMAVVTDNYGGTLGVVTVEDILEELVGEIWDEDDVPEEPIVELDGGVLLVDADESVSDVMERLDYEDPDGDEELVNTRMGEWAYEQFSAIPQVGDSFRYHELEITVTSMEHNRIRKLKAALLPKAEEGGEQA